jgi:hypothetical protein
MKPNGKYFHVPAPDLRGQENNLVMSITYEIKPHCLVLKADAETRRELRENYPGEELHSDQAMHEVLEPLICNSELDWVYPEEVGALTSAPMLGLLGELNDHGPGRLVGRWSGCCWYAPIEQCWAFMSYQVRSVVQDLVEHGEAVFQKG